MWLGLDAGLRLWADTQKGLVSDLDEEAPDDVINDPESGEWNQQGDTWYIWSINSSTVDLPTDQLYVEGIDVDGVALGDRRVYWRLVKPNGVGYNTADVIARDTVRINVEEMVWPNQDPTADWDEDETTDKWNGFAVPDGWRMSSSLCQIMNGTMGYIRTEYPEETDTNQWQGTAAKETYAKLDLGEVCGTPTWGTGVTIRVEVSYEFDQSPYIATGQYVDTNYAQCKEGFFHNSGIKIENRSEIQIFDTASLLDAINNGHAAIIDGQEVTISADPSNNINTTGKVLLRHTDSEAGDWIAEDVNALISGIPYATGPVTLAALTAAPQGAQTMIIDVFRETDGEFTFTVTIDGHTTTFTDIYRVNNDPRDPDMLYLQSHWGGGVKFTSVKVKELED